MLHVYLDQNCIFVSGSTALNHCQFTQNQLYVVSSEHLSYSIKIVNYQYSMMI